MENVSSESHTSRPVNDIEQTYCIIYQCCTIPWCHHNDSCMQQSPMLADVCFIWTVDPTAVSHVPN